MKKILGFFLVILCVVTLVGCEKPKAEIIPVYRFSNPTLKQHAYVLSEVEKNKFVTNNSSDWNFDGEAFKTYDHNRAESLPVHKFTSDKYQYELYTIDKDEKELLQKNPNWKYADIAWYADAQSSDDNVPVYQLQSGGHRFYTRYASEKELLEQTPGWIYETIAFYVAP